MRAREFQMRLSSYTGATVGEVDQRTRFLRALGEVRTGKRGPWGPDIEPVEASCMLIAMVSRRATDAGSVFKRANALPVVPRVIAGKAHLADATLGSVIAAVLSSPENWSDSFAIDRLEIEENGEFAWLRIASMNILFTADEKIRNSVAKSPETYDRQYGGAARRFYVMSGALLEQIALDLDNAPAKYTEA